uniref:Ankyrin-1 n=3 Tax=Lygus hesperus TaxID=30085 RepID=A0A0A9Z7P8_LYGHE
MLNYIPYLYAVLEGHQDIVELMVTSTNINHVESLGYTALHCSCKHGYTGIVRYLLGKGAEVNAKANNGRTSLHIAVLNGFREIINLLLKKGASINDADSFGNTPLHYAAMVGQAKVVEMLIQRGALINKVNEDGWTPLHMACSSGSIECASLLVNKGCSVNASSKGEATPLLMSVESNNINIVKFLIKQKVKFDNNALRQAVLSGFADILELLLVSFPNNSRVTELLWPAVIKRHPEIIKILVKRGADVNAICIETSQRPLHFAVFMGYYEIIKLLLDLGADPNGRSSNGDIPLHLASESGHLETVVALLTNISQISAKDSEGRTPLGIAVANGHANIVGLFLNKDKTINNCFHTKQLTPLLHLAARYGKTEVVKLLVQKGADINGKTYNGWKAIHVAAYGGFADIVEFFLLRGISLYDSTENGDNLLHYVAKGSGDRLSVAKLLVSNKRMDLNRCNDSGCSPLHSAVVASNDITLIKFFLENGSYYDVKTNEGEGMKDIANSFPIRLIFHSVQQLFTEGKRGNLSLVKNSIREGAVVNAKNERNETPLLCATWKGNANVVIELLTSGANPDLADKSGSTPLHYASKLSHYNIAIALLGRGAVFEPLNHANKTPLDYATDSRISNVLKLIQNTFLKIKSLDVEILDSLRKKKLRPDEVRALVNCRDRQGKTILACAILANFPDVKGLRSIFRDNQNLERAERSLKSGCSRESLSSATLERKQRKFLLFSDDSLMNTEVDMVIVLSLCEEQSYDEGLLELQKLYETYNKMLGENNELTIAAERLKASVLIKKGKTKCALKLLETIIERQKSVLSPLHIDLIKTEMHMSEALSSVGKLDKALELNYDLIERFKLIHRGENPITLRIRNNIAKILFKKGKIDEALRLHKQVLEMRKETLGPKHRETIQTMVDIGFVYSSQKKCKEAVQLIVDAMKIQFETVGKSCGVEEGINRKKTFDLLREGKIVNVFKNQVDHEFRDDQEMRTPGEIKFFEMMERERSQGHHNFFNEGGIDGNRQPDILEKLHNLIGRGGNIMRINHVDGMLTADTSPLNEKDVPFFSKLLGAETIWSSDDFFPEERINMSTEAYEAIARGDMTVVARLIDGGMDFNATDEEGRTYLHYAVSSGKVHLVESLIDHGAKVNVKSKKGNTPLHTAALLGSADICEVLMKRVEVTERLDFIDMKTKKGGMTALHIAASKGKLEVAKTLLKNGAAFDVTNNECKTPLDLSVNEEVTSILKKLDKVFRYCHCSFVFPQGVQ